MVWICNGLHIIFIYVIIKVQMFLTLSKPCVMFPFNFLALLPQLSFLLKCHLWYFLPLLFQLSLLWNQNLKPNSQYRTKERLKGHCQLNTFFINLVACISYQVMLLSQPQLWVRNQGKGLQRCRPRMKPRSHISCSHDCKKV